MTAALDLPREHWIGPGILVVSAMFLLILSPGSVLYWMVLVLAIMLSVGSVFSTSRWLVALPGVFTVGLLAAYLQSLNLPLSSCAILVAFAGLSGIAYWVLPSSNFSKLAIAYASGLGLTQVFIVLEFWPVNFPSRALVTAAVAFLLFEFIERRSRGLGFHDILGTVGLVLVALISIIVTANWQTF